MYCGQCGHDISEDSEFCRWCGAYMDRQENEVHVHIRTDNIEPQKRTFALLLAIVPGFFDVFGLGHIYLGKYLKGIIFLAVSVILFAINVTMEISSWEIYFTLGTLALFMVQIVDIFKIVYN